VAKLAGRFTGHELDTPVTLSVYESHLEISVTTGEAAVAIRVPLDEIARIRIQEILGFTTLVIEDTARIEVAAVRMDRDEADRAQEVINHLRLYGI
jgi:hypothetical protein